MITISQDPLNPDRLSLTATVTLYLDKLLVATLSDELTQAIKLQAVKDLQTNSAVKKLVARAASEKLLEMLGYIKPEQKSEEKPNV